MKLLLALVLSGSRFAQNITISRIGSQPSSQGEVIEEAKQGKGEKGEDHARNSSLRPSRYSF